MSWEASNAMCSPQAAVDIGPAFSPSPLPAESPQQDQAAGNLGERQNSVVSLSQDDAGKDRATVPSACVQCRSKHLKCDGRRPCTRCASNEFECLYVRSRRGFKGPRKNGGQIKPAGAAGAASGPVVRTGVCPLVQPGAHSALPLSASSPSGVATPPDHRMQVLPPDLGLFNGSQELMAFEPRPLSHGMDLRERCLEAFYYHFYPAHPCILPRFNFMALRKEKSLGPLEAAMRYVGSFYVPQAPTVELLVETERAVYDMSCPKDAFRVQAMLILAIGLDGYSFQEKALQILLDAQDLALELGMNKREFAAVNGNGSSILEESWRRTWWELFVVDGLIAGVHQKSSFRLSEVAADVGLPCEERDYEAGTIPPTLFMRDFDDEPFDGRDLSFSSFTYRIAAIRNLGRLLRARQAIMPNDPIIDRIDAHLVNWRLHLPEAKKTFICSDGQLDEMIFQANMITEATTINLHREHSQLDSSVTQNVNSCAPHQKIVPGQKYNVHAAKTIQAAQNISKLITIPTPLAKHTHFFTCVVTLASVIHLSCWSVLMPVIHDDDLKQQLRLNTGALKSLSQVWPSAGCAFGQVKGVAQELFAAKKAAAEVGFWNDFTDDEVMRSMIEDQSIMAELQLL